MSEAAQALGQQLKAEREKRGMSAQKMADDMHLDAWVIDALEAGDYERIGPSVYAQGHLRKYASILGVLAAPAPQLTWVTVSLLDQRAEVVRAPQVRIHGQRFLDKWLGAFRFALLYQGPRHVEPTIGIPRLGLGDFRERIFGALYVAL